MTAERPRLRGIRDPLVSPIDRQRVSPCGPTDLFLEQLKSRTLDRYVTQLLKPLDPDVDFPKHTLCVGSLETSGCVWVELAWCGERVLAND